MGRGSSSAGGGISAQIKKAEQPINISKTGANYKKLPVNFQKNIETNLMPSKVFKENVMNNKIIEDEWTVGLNKSKRKQKVITSMRNGKLGYTVKERNKIIIRTDDKNKVANKIAQFLNEELRKVRG